MLVVIKKCKFFTRKIDFIRFIIKLRYISIDVKKVKAIVTVVCKSIAKIKLSEPRTQHRLLVSSPYKSYACHAYTYYFYFQNSEVLYLYYIIHLGQFLSVIGAMVARKSLQKRAAS